MKTILQAKPERHASQASLHPSAPGEHARLACPEEASRLRDRAQRACAQSHESRSIVRQGLLAVLSRCARRFRRDAKNNTRDACAPRLLAALVLGLFIAPGIAAEERAPERHELWVPNKHWATVLAEHPNAVMLTPEQYEALIRDAGKIKLPEEAEKQSTTAVVESMKFTATPQLGEPLLKLHGDITLRCLTDEWTHATASLPWINLASASVDGSVVIGLNEVPGSNTKLAANDAAPTQRKLFVKGKGTHHIACDIIVRLHVTSLAGAQRLNFQTTNAPAVLELTLPESAAVFDTPCSYVREGSVVKFLLHASGKPETRGILWRLNVARAASPSPSLSEQDARSTLGLRPDQQSYGIAKCDITDHSIETQWDLDIVRDPAATKGDTFTFEVIPADAIVLSVEGDAITKWEQQGAKLSVTARAGERNIPFKAALRSVLDLQGERDTGSLPARAVPSVAVNEAQRAGSPSHVERGIQTHALPMLRFSGAISQDHQATIASLAEGVALLAIQTQLIGGVKTETSDPKSQVSDFKCPTTAGSLISWNPQRETLSLLLRKAEPRVVVDADAHVRIGRDNIDIDRTLSIQTDSPINDLFVSLPEGEEFIETREVSGPLFEWKRAEQTLTYTWPETLRPGGIARVNLKTRLRIPSAGVADAKAQSSDIKVQIANLAIPNAKKLAGYIALDYDSAWRVLVGTANGLEERDGRVTPVRGKLAWFALRSFELGLTLQRREPVFDSAITAYALPRAKTIEIEGEVTLTVSEAPLRKLTVQFDKASAALVRFTSPLVGEQSLDAATGLWSLVLRQEMMGRVALRFRLSLPATMQAPVTASPPKDDGTRTTENVTSTAELPQVQTPAARRSHGVWVIEANTDTELSFEPHAMQPLDVLRAPAIEDYQPRHRVVAAFEYLPAQSDTGSQPVSAQPRPPANNPPRAGSPSHAEPSPTANNPQPKTDNEKRGTPTLQITASRHAHSELAALVVSDMRLISVLGSDGSTRHQASLVMQHSGEQFLNMQLPAGAQLLSLIANDQPVKPVRGPAGTISIPLPPTSANRPDLSLRLLYETPAEPWTASGTRPLQPPQLASDIPVLATDWQVYAPEGYSFKKVNTPLEQEGTGYQGEAFRLVNYSVTKNMDFLPGGQAMMAIPAAPDAKRNDFTEASRDHQRSRMLNSVSEAWESKVPEEPYVGTVTQNSGNYLSTKMKSIIFPQFTLKGATIDEAIEYLRVKSRDLDKTETDPTRRGVNLILKTGDVPSNASITLDLKDVPMEEALRYVVELAGMKYKVEPFAVIVSLIGEGTPELMTRFFKAPSDFLRLSGNRNNTSAREVLIPQGITFPEGAEAQFNPRTSQLVVKNTPTNLDLVQLYVEPLARQEELKNRDPNELESAVGSVSPDKTRYLSMKMKSIVFPQVAFKNATIDEAIEYLRSKGSDLDSSETDPAKRGVNIILQTGETPSAATITLDLKDVPLDDALRYVVELAGMKFKVEPFAVLVVPISESKTEQFTRIYKVPRNFQQIVQNSQSSAIVTDPFSSVGGAASHSTLMPRMSAKDILTSRGILFPEGASAVFNPAQGQLIVKSTQPNLDMVESFVSQLNAKPQTEEKYVDASMFDISWGARAKEMEAERESRNRAKAYSDRMRKIILPKLSFAGATIQEAVKELRKLSITYDTTEQDTAKKGIQLKLFHGEVSSSATITLDLKDVPVEEALRYVVELAGMKFKVEADGVLILPISESTTEQVTRVYAVPNDFKDVITKIVGSPLVKADFKEILASQGISFPENSSASYDAKSKQLVVKQTAPNLDMIEVFLSTVWQDSSDTPPNPIDPTYNRDQESRSNPENFGSIGVGAVASYPKSVGGLIDISRFDVATKEGLLSLDLDLPTAGQRLWFHGMQGPVALDLKYVSWERQVTWACAMLVLGALGFWRVGRRRPWLFTGLVVVLLGLGVGLVAEDWQPLANGLLWGWLTALVLWLVWRAVSALDVRFNERRAGV